MSINQIIFFPYVCATTILVFWGAIILLMILYNSKTGMEYKVVNGKRTMKNEESEKNSTPIAENTPITVEKTDNSSNTDNTEISVEPKPVIPTNNTSAENTVAESSEKGVPLFEEENDTRLLEEEQQAFGIEETVEEDIPITEQTENPDIDEEIKVTSKNAGTVQDALFEQNFEPKDTNITEGSF